MPGLPAAGVAARFRAEYFTTGVVREVLLNPELQQPGEPDSTKLHVDEGQREEIAAYLLKIGILDRLSHDEPRLENELGEALTSGGFGVVKVKAEKVFVAGKEWTTVLRLIWNLT